MRDGQCGETQKKNKNGGEGIMLPRPLSRAEHGKKLVGGGKKTSCFLREFSTANTLRPESAKGKLFVLQVRLGVGKYSGRQQEWPGREKTIRNGHRGFGCQGGKGGEIVAIEKRAIEKVHFAGQSRTWRLKQGGGLE